MRAAAFILLASLLSACAPEPLRSVDTGEPAAVQAARVAIDEANGALTALNRTIGANVEQDIWTPDQAQAWLDESKSLGRKVDEARKALRLGDVTSAEGQAKAVRELILILHRKAAEQGELR